LARVGVVMKLRLSNSAGDRPDDVGYRFGHRRRALAATEAWVGDLPTSSPIGGRRRYAAER
jgi:hypothetical protein